MEQLYTELMAQLLAAMAETNEVFGKHGSDPRAYGMEAPSMINGAIYVPPYWDGYMRHPETWAIPVLYEDQEAVMVVHRYTAHEIFVFGKAPVQKIAEFMLEV